MVKFVWEFDSFSYSDSLKRSAAHVIHLQYSFFHNSFTSVINGYNIELNFVPWH